ncbi:DJ-1/PfpI family protein [uncultured Paraglaciecola sp.]|jgi:transcriptional regulator GlxA family with amidase domain|uniref:GlxA family transcriptional regulator n=1 Tax=uncultured Paraglaciecola sp. TaxID=1765024 RepID=UPI0025EB0727|nr:DJ-1/PfpI family protein [uncultured Paraglaciecola sp.]
MFATRRILFVIFDQFELLDLSGPSSVFTAAKTLVEQPIYSICTLSSGGGLIGSRSGIEVNSQAIEGFNVRSSDTILIVGGEKKAISQVSEKSNLSAWLALNSQKAERLGSICSGALVLAANDLLHGRKATTHWADLEQLSSDYPRVNVEQDALYCIDDNIWTSAGVTTGIDMALAMVGKDHDQKVMHKVASWLVVYAQRLGHQSQFSELLAAQNQHMFSDIVVWLDRNLHKPIKVRDMAEQSAMTERTFYRKFTDEVGCTPSKFLENRRLFRAKHLLETGSVVKSVSVNVGYKSILGFCSAFEAKYGLSPALYKRIHCK